MNDTVLIIGGIAAIVILLGGGGWLYRTAFKRGRDVASTVERAAPVEPNLPYKG